VPQQKTKCQKTKWGVTGQNEVSQYKTKCHRTKRSVTRQKPDAIRQNEVPQQKTKCHKIKRGATRQNEVTQDKTRCHKSSTKHIAEISVGRGTKNCKLDGLTI
jgi:hypothetical protein